MEMNIKKLGLIGIMTLLCTVVGFFIQDLIRDREQLSNETQEEIAASWGNSQTFAGPVLCVPVYKDNETQPVNFTWITPETLDVDANVNSETLHRGIFDASVYRSTIVAKGKYNLAGMDDSMEGKHHDWSRVQVVVGISDDRSIEEGMKLTLPNGKATLDNQFDNLGNPTQFPIFTDLTCICGMVDLTKQKDRTFELTLNANLKGSGEMFFKPLGRDSKITIHGNCADPSFSGMQLPSSREVNGNGFTATWKIHNLTGQAPVAPQEQTVDGDEEEKLDAVGTKFLVVGGQYTQTDRALKYDFLVVLLSLLAVFVGEMSVRSRINSLNYILISGALAIFYLLLLSIAEWTGFDMAYVISAVLVLGMIALYLKAIVKRFLTVLAIILFMALVDVFVYVLLSIADMALLLGTIGLFVTLGIAMFFSLRLKTVEKESKKLENVQPTDETNEEDSAEEKATEESDDENEDEDSGNESHEEESDDEK